MGLFDALGDLFGSDNKAKAIQQGTAAEVAADNQGIGALQTQQGLTNANLAPWMSAGTSALGAEEGLTGLGGAGVQQSAIAALQNSPLYQSLYRTGQNAVLSNASATGGLRGGNITNSLANFGQSTLAQTIQQQLSNLGGISTQGLNATDTDAQTGLGSSGAIANIFTQQGQQQAAGIEGQAAAQNQGISALAGIGTSLFGNGSTSGAGSTGALGSVGGLFSSLGSSLGSLLIPAFGF